MRSEGGSSPCNTVCARDSVTTCYAIQLSRQHVCTQELGCDGAPVAALGSLQGLSNVRVYAHYASSIPWRHYPRPEHPSAACCRMFAGGQPLHPPESTGVCRSRPTAQHSSKVCRTTSDTLSTSTRLLQHMTVVGLGALTGNPASGQAPFIKQLCGTFPHGHRTGS